MRPYFTTVSRHQERWPLAFDREGATELDISSFTSIDSIPFSNILPDKMSIQPLPPDVIAQIKSSTAITSLNGVVSELLKNSLDASSTKVEITVDYSRGSCAVEDDGFGILPPEFGEDGGLGKLYREHFPSNVKTNC